MSAATADGCPRCNAPGRKVRPTTPRSLLKPEAIARLDAAGDLRFCRTRDCDVVYFGAAGTIPFDTGDLRVAVFQKSTDPNRLVCYCFEQSVAGIQDEVQRTGQSGAAERITARCRAGLDRCDETNPQGSCCLGNVRAVVGARDGADPEASPPPAKRRSSAGLWSVGGALVAAILSSACCWLPLLLVALGASAAGVAGVFEAYRAWFLGIAAVLLAGGFYVVYRREPRCRPGEPCEMPDPRRRRLNRAALWVATAFVAAFAAFPDYVGHLVGGGEAENAVAATPAAVIRIYTVEGMTCAGCAGHTREALEQVPGVASVDVSYPDGTARVTFANAAAVDDARVAAAAASLGYRATATQ